jgi:GRAM domain-containing protein 4
MQKITPYLPPAYPSAPPFTLGRLRLSTQRLYLALEPLYVPLLRLFRLAAWEDKQTSAIYCAVCLLYLTFVGPDLTDVP